MLNMSILMPNYLINLNKNKKRTVPLVSLYGASMLSHPGPRHKRLLMSSASTSKSSCIFWIAACVYTSLAYSGYHIFHKWPRSNTSERQCPCSQWLGSEIYICNWAPWPYHQYFLCFGLVNLTPVGVDSESADSTEARSCNVGGEWSVERRWMIRLFVSILPFEDSSLEPSRDLSRFGGLFSTTDLGRWEIIPTQPGKFQRRDIEKYFTATYRLVNMFTSRVVLVSWETP